ncbi:MAG: hypothetical protein ACI9MC_003736 [Kiritimatiellia bacterium]|jgi:uncharacterized protein (DUF1330 family)
MLQIVPDALESWNQKGDVLALAIRRGSCTSCEEAVCSARGAPVFWRADAELLLIGAGELPFTELLLVRFGDAAALRRSIENGGLQELSDMLPDLVDAHVLIVREQSMPTAARVALRLVRLSGKIRGQTDAAPAKFDNGGLYPTELQLASLHHSTWNGQVTMVNFLKFHDKADYDSDISGYDAYNRYGQVAIRNIYRLGGSLTFFGRTEACLVDSGAQATEGAWDQLALISYPHRSRFHKLPMSPGYFEATKHRNAGLDRTALVMMRS